MKTLGNILWHFPCFGFLMAFHYFVMGSILTILGITAPYGIGLMKISKMLLTPFGKDVVRNGEYGLQFNSEFKDNKFYNAYKKYEIVFKIFWYPLGVVLACLHCLAAIGCAMTIINIPLALIQLKLAKAIFNPVGIFIVDSDLVKAAKNKHTSEKLNELTAA
tara:strand:+ start:64 stop:549 length:486 start_codon:yes stop_codon:yes gene_type:complete